MTWVTDDTGRRWIEVPQKKRRKPARALRFAEIKVGDQLMRKWDSHLNNGVVVWYYQVSDLWFDPVAGQDDPTAGSMVAIQLISHRTGEVNGRKNAHTLRGLASQGFRYADIDYIAHAAARNAALVTGEVVSIGRGHVIRARPKVPGSRF